MPEDSDFQELIRRVREGDADAAAALVQKYEPTIRRVVRFRLRDRRLRRRLDSLDICQSVLASFFVRAALGQFELNQSEQLVKLLTVMVRNKVANHANREGAQCRDYRQSGELPEEDELEQSGPSPSEQLASRDLLEEARRRMSPEERQVLDLRARGEGWAEIAAQLGENADAVRKRLTRATERVSQELGLDTSHDE